MASVKAHIFQKKIIAVERCISVHKCVISETLSCFNPDEILIPINFFIHSIRILL